MADDTQKPAVSGAGDTIYLRLHLLDRQVVDPNDRMVCKVDDLELEIDADGTPYVSALLCGPLALGPRLGGRLGSWVSAIARRLSPSAQPVPGRIGFEHVEAVTSAIEIRVSRTTLDVTALEDWVNAYVIGRIPGNRHESE